MLRPDLWDALELDPRDVRQRASFFLAYPDAKRRFIDPLALLGGARASSSEARGRLTAFGDPPGMLEEDDRHEESLYEGWRDAEGAGWAREIDEGDSLREAGASLLTVDPEAGIEVLGRASRAYRDPNPAYARFLEALGSAKAGEIDEIAAGAGEELRAGRPRDDAASRSDPSLLPSQELHLMLVLGSSPRIASDRPRRWPGELAELPQARSPMPVGTAGAPLAVWWRLALLLLDSDPAASRRQELRDLFARLALSHGEQLSTAKMDRFHWRAQKSAVDLVDLDLAGAISLANRSLGEAGEALDSADFAELPALAQVSTTVGLEMSTPAAGPTPA